MSRTKISRFAAEVTFLLVAVVLACAYTILPLQRALALSGSDFSAGHIVDDAVFTNTNTMSAQDIQRFLDAKVGTCDNNGTGIASAFGSSLTRAAYDASIGKNTKFTCINQYYENTTTLANNLDGNPTPAGAISAAQIIYNAAQQYRINPQVLIITIQKEQGLVTDTWPWNSEYQKATGYFCPDSAACNTQYYGFYNQVTNAAAQFRRYLDHPNNYNYVVGQNYILYSPAAGCTGSYVNIQNQATAALYDYTPYQPNAGALSGLSSSSAGGSSTCGSYGNRNFWWYFNVWFGSTYEEFSYAFEPIVGAGAYTIPSDVTVAAKKTLTLGGKIYTLYGDTKSHTLQLLYWNGSSWSKFTLDGPGSISLGSTQSNVDPESIEVFAYGGSLQYFYIDTLTNTVKHGFVINGLLAVETLDGDTTSYLGKDRNLGSAISGFSYGGNGIQLYYFNTSDNTLIHTWWDGRTWNTETLDGDTTSYLGKDRNLGSAISGFSYGGNGIQLYYFNTSDNTLIHTWWDGRTWNTETLDGDTTSYLGKDRNLGSAISGTPYGDGIQLFYHDITNGELIHTFILNGRWVTEVMDGSQNSILGNNINAGKEIQTANINGRLIVLYYDDATSFSDDGHTSSWRIVYTSKNGGGWVQGILDGGTTASKSGSATPPTLNNITVAGYENTIQIFYNDSTNSLRHVWLYW